MIKNTEAIFKVIILFLVISCKNWPERDPDLYKDVTEENNETYRILKQIERGEIKVVSKSQHCPCVVTNKEVIDHRWDNETMRHTYYYKDNCGNVTEEQD